MPVKVIRNRIIPLGRRFGAVNLFGVVFAKKDTVIDMITLNHESIHSCQMKELLYVFFYIFYAVEWSARFFTSGFRWMRSYRAVSFEREAYRHEHDLDYVANRRRFAQWRDF